MKNAKINDIDEMPAEVDFSGGVRGKYAAKFPRGSRLVLLDSDVAKVFPTQKAANEALRGLAELIKKNKAAAPARNAKAHAGSKS